MKKVMQINDLSYYINFTSASSLIAKFDNWIEEGIEINFNEEHPLKALYPISVTDDGIDISTNDVHLEKAFFPIDVNDDGSSNVIFINELHSLKALSFISLTEEGIVISSSEQHSENAS